MPSGAAAPIPQRWPLRRCTMPVPRCGCCGAWPAMPEPALRPPQAALHIVQSTMSTGRVAERGRKTPRCTLADHSIQSAGQGAILHADTRVFADSATQT